VVSLVLGVTAARVTTGDGSSWSTGPAVHPGRTDPVSLASATASDLGESTAATGVWVDHPLRVVIGSSDAPEATAVIA